MEGPTRRPWESEFAAGLDDFTESTSPPLPPRLLEGLRAGVDEGLCNCEVMERTDVVLGIKEAGRDHTEDQLEARIDYLLGVIRGDVEDALGNASWLERLADIMAGRRKRAVKRALAQNSYRDAIARRNQKNKGRSVMNDKVQAVYDTVKDQFQNLRDGLNLKLADGSLSIRDIVAIVREFCTAGTVIAEELNVPGPEKKVLVVAAMMDWWNDPVDGLKKIDLPGPDSILDPMIEAVLPVLTGAAIDWIMGGSNKVG